MNTFLICLSLKYINKNYKLICNVSKWIYFELTKLNYKESKFITSISNKDLEIIKTLIKFNKNVDLLSRFMVSFCLYKNNYFDMVKLFIDNGADIHFEDDEVLKWTSYYGNYNIVKLLVDNGANVHSKDNLSLLNACFAGHLDIVKLLVENGADVHIQDNQAFKVAIIDKRDEIVNFLESHLLKLSKLN